MNLVKHSIKEVHSVKKAEKRDRMVGDYVVVDMTVNCWGNITRSEHMMSKARWNQMKSQGYYMG